MSRLLVLDASVTLALCYPDETSDYADAVVERLAVTGGRVPSLWAFEVTNSLLIGERSRRLSTADVTRFLALIESLPIMVEETIPERVLHSVRLRAREHNLTAYDAAYLDLAMREGLTLATLDRDLVTAARASGVNLFEAS